MTVTGSEAAGRAIGAAAGRHLKKSVLELGGSDPFLVLGSADLDQAVATAVKARTINTGQSCIAAKRFIVVDAVYDRFAAAFTEAMRGLVVGDPDATRARRSARSRPRRSATASPTRSNARCRRAPAC